MRRIRQRIGLDDAPSGSHAVSNTESPLYPSTSPFPYPQVSSRCSLHRSEETLLLITEDGYVHLMQIGAKLASPKLKEKKSIATLDVPGGGFAPFCFPPLNS